MQKKNLLALVVVTLTISLDAFAFQSPENSRTQEFQCNSVRKKVTHRFKKSDPKRSKNIDLYTQKNGHYIRPETASASDMDKTGKGQKCFLRRIIRDDETAKAVGITVTLRSPFTRLDTSALVECEVKWAECDSY